MNEIFECNSDLGLLADIEMQLRQVPVAAPRAEEFERVHRLALKVAGLVQQRAQRSRVRALPANVWVSLSRLGGIHAERAREVEPFVELRQRIVHRSNADHLLTLDQVEQHRALTLAYLESVRSEVSGALLQLAA